MQCGNEIYISLDLSFSCVDRTGRTARSTFFSMEILMSRPFCRQNRLSILATPTQQQLTTNRLEIGVSFSSGLPGWFRSCFFVCFIKDFSGTAQISLGFSARRSGLGMSFSAGRGDPAGGRPGMRVY